MKKSEIRVGGYYLAKVNGRVTTVRVDAIREGGFTRGGSQTAYDVTNLRTGRKTTFRSAAKFRDEPRSIMDPHLNDAPADPTSGVSEPAPSVDSSKEGDNSSDPTLTALTDAASAHSVAEHKPGDPGFDPSVMKEVCRCSRCRAIRRGETVIEETQKPLTAPQVKQMFEATDTAKALEDEKRSDHLEPVAQPVAPPSSNQDGAGPAGEPSKISKLTAKLAGIRMAEAVSKEERDGKVAGMTPTEEQASILEVARQSGLKVLVIGAGAGTGKTATLKMLEQTIPGLGQYTAFNSSLVAESKVKFVRAQCNTTHSLAFRAVGRLYAKRLGGPRVRSDQVARQLGIEALQVETTDVDNDGKPKTKMLQAGFLAGQLMVAIRKFCQSADRSIKAGHFRYIDGIDQPVNGRRTSDNNRKVREYLLHFAEKAWADLSNPDGHLPFNHDIYVKVWQLGEGVNRPVISADYILLDESQDTAPVMLDILKQQTHALLVLVGDSNQQIYEWRGAVDAMKAFPRAPRRLLSQSFRFGQIIADVANSILKNLEEPTDLVMKGLPSIPSRVGTLSNPRCILCRTNAAAVGYVLRGIKDDKKPHLIGGGSDVVSFVKAAKDLQVPRPTSHPELCCFESWKEVQEYVKTDEGEDLKLMVKLVDEFGADDILRALEHMPAEKDADFAVSTAHKSKGREWDTVKLAQDFPPISKMGDPDIRLLYVAATRAKLVLDISECPPFCGAKGKEDEGSSVPGIEVCYTVPMPTAEQTGEYLSNHNDKPALGVSPAHSNGESKATPKNDPQPIVDRAQYTWASFNGGWAVRGPAGTPIGTKVTVTRRSGTTSMETLKEVMARYPDVWLYRV